MKSASPIPTKSDFIPRKWDFFRKMRISLKKTHIVLVDKCVLFSGGDVRTSRIVVCLRLDTLGSSYSLLCGEKLRRKRYSIVFASFSDLNRRESRSLLIYDWQLQNKNAPDWVHFVLEVTIGFEPMDNGVADRGLTTWLRHQKDGADYGARTRHLDLGKVALYQMS